MSGSTYRSHPCSHHPTQDIQLGQSPRQLPPGPHCEEGKDCDCSGFLGNTLQSVRMWGTVSESQGMRVGVGWGLRDVRGVSQQVSPQDAFVLLRWGQVFLLPVPTKGPIIVLLCLLIFIFPNCTCGYLPWLDPWNLISKRYCLWMCTIRQFDIEI